MNDSVLFEKWSQLPDNLKSRVSEFIDALFGRKSENKEIRNKPSFGSGKGMFVMKQNFDEPLEDFKEYL